MSRARPIYTSHFRFPLDVFKQTTNALITQGRDTKLLLGVILPWETEQPSLSQPCRSFQSKAESCVRWRQKVEWAIKHSCAIYRNENTKTDTTHIPCQGPQKEQPGVVFPVPTVNYSTLHTSVRYCVQ